MLKRKALSLKRGLKISGFLGLAAAVVFAAPASADLKGKCMIDGEAKMRDKVEDDEGVQIVGQEGKFTFRSLSMACVGDSDKDGIPEVVTGLTARATGWYDNTVCGTGKAFGTVTRISGGPAKLQRAVGEEFAVQFFAAHGVFKWRDWNKPDVPVPKVQEDSDHPDKDTYDGTPAGWITLSLPTTEKPMPSPEEVEENTAQNECTKAFRVTGVLVGHFAD